MGLPPHANVVARKVLITGTGKKENMRFRWLLLWALYPLISDSNHFNSSTTRKPSTGKVMPRRLTGYATAEIAETNVVFEFN